MAHDIQVKVLLTADEYVAFKLICEREGQSQSGRARQLIKADIRSYAATLPDSDLESTGESGQELGKGNVR